MSKYKFVTDAKSDVIVWDSKRGREAARFKGGSLITDDKDLVDQLKKYYEYELIGSEKPKNKKTKKTADDFTMAQLREFGKELQIVRYTRMNKVELFDALIEGGFCFES